MATTKPETVEKKEETVKVRIPKTKEQQDAVFVSVNDRTWLIPRGVEVEIPKCAAAQLLHQQEMLEEAMAYQEEVTKPKIHY